MPCSDRDNGENEARLARKVDHLTAMLCFVLQIHDPADLPKDEDDMAIRIRKWWLKHQAEDRAREQAEAEERKRKEMRNAALRKLSAEERRALGIR